MPLPDFFASSDVPPAADALAETVDVPAEDDVNVTAPPALKDRNVVANALSSTTFTPMPMPTAESPAAFAPADVTEAPV